MSKRFNKSEASDFGLIPKDMNTAINPNDNSLWIKCSLYDFGWGKENGYYKTPLPNIDELFYLALSSSDEEDLYGAASIILENYGEELLIKCEMIIDDPTQRKVLRRMIEVFGLETPINRSSIFNKSYDQIQSDHARWLNISRAVTKNEPKGRFFKRRGGKTNKTGDGLREPE